MKPNTKVYSNKEIGVALNNALVATFGSAALSELTEGRKAKLREYTRAIIDAVLDHRKQGLLTAEELVSVLTATALMVHVLLVAKGGAGKLAAYEALASSMAKDLTGE